MTTPPLPNNIGKRRKLKDIDGRPVYFTVKDEIARHTRGRRKAIYLQQFEYEQDGSIEYRFGYYMIGVKRARKGQWVWGQYALLLTAQELSALLKEARKRKWPGI